MKVLESLEQWIGRRTGPRYDYAVAYLTWWHSGGSKPTEASMELAEEPALKIRRYINGCTTDEKIRAFESLKAGRRLTAMETRHLIIKGTALTHLDLPGHLAAIDVVTVKVKTSTGGWRMKPVLCGVVKQMADGLHVWQYASSFESRILNALSKHLKGSKTLYWSRPTMGRTPWPPRKIKADNLWRRGHTYNVEEVHVPRTADIEVKRITSMWDEGIREPIWRHNQWNILDVVARAAALDAKGKLFF